MPKRVVPLIQKEAIAERMETLAREIAATTQGELVLVSLLRGSFIFTADLIRALHMQGLSMKVDFMVLGSYRAAMESSGTVMLHHGLMDDIRGQDVLIVDDILESGRTLAVAKELLAARGAKRVRVAVLLEKPHKRKVDIEAEFIGFTVEDKFVVGYGLDYANQFRELPYIGVLE
jgi:hypoxanthine phosphoribosyltransferase